MILSQSTIPEYGITLLPLLFMFFIGCIGIGFFAFWIWMLIDCLKYEEEENNNKIVWVIVIVFTHWIGALIYFFVRRSERLKAGRKH